MKRGGKYLYISKLFTVYYTYGIEGMWIKTCYLKAGMHIRFHISSPVPARSAAARLAALCAAASSVYLKDAALRILKASL